MRIKFVNLICLLLIFSSYLYSAVNNLYDTHILRTLKLEFSQSNWWQQLTTNYQSKQNLLAKLTVDGEVYDSVGVRFRGMTSYQQTRNSQKKSFNIEIDWKKNQDVMGYETLNLINCLEDPTFMREVLYSNMCRLIMPSARANFVTLEINGTNWGVYVSVQQLDGDFTREWFPSNDGTRWKVDMGNPGAGGGMQPPGGGGGGVTSGGGALTYLGTDSSKYNTTYIIKNTNQENPWESLIHTCDILNNTSLAELPTALESVLNVDRALWLCAFEIVFHDDDGYIHKRGADYYLYYEPESGRIHPIQYDANSSMIMKNNEQWALFFRADDQKVPIMYRLMQIPQHRQRYLAHVRTLLNEYLTDNFLVPQIDAYKTLISTEVKSDTKKLYANQAFENGVTELKNFIQKRRTCLLSQTEINRSVPEIVTVNKNILNNGTKQQLIISAQISEKTSVQAVNLYLAESYYGRFTPLSMCDDGSNGDVTAKDRIYTLRLPAYPVGTVLRYYVQAIANDSYGTMVFLPAAEHLACKHVMTSPLAANSPVLFNELMAQNSATIADPQGDYDDWIELVNISDDTIDLTGKYLSDNPDNPLKWKFPENTKIEPNGYIIIWADEDGKAEAGLHANFKLSANGEVVLLFDTDENGNALLDSVSFSTQSSDQSFGRFPNASATWLSLSTPTPGATNKNNLSSISTLETPRTFQLWPAFPNPFNPETTISFSIPSAQKISITIFDTRGREVATLVDTHLPAGDHQFHWQAAAYPSGVYFYQFKSDSYTSVRKMMLVK